MLGKELGGQSILLPLKRRGVLFRDGMNMPPAAQAKLNISSILTDDAFALAKLGDWLGGSLCF